MAHLRVWSPETALERIIPLDANELIVGRDPACGLVLGGVAASRQHARLVRGSDGWNLEDCGSANGTLVGGQRISRHLLRHGDEIRLGDSLLIFVAEAAIPPPLPRPVPPPVPQEARPPKPPALPARRRIGRTIGVVIGALLVFFLFLAAFILWRAGGIRGLTEPSVHLTR